MEAGEQSTLHEAPRGACSESESWSCAAAAESHSPQGGMADVTHSSCSSAPASAAASHQADALNTPPGAATSALQVAHLCCLSILPCSTGRCDAATKLVTIPQNPDKGQLPPSPPPGLCTTRSGMYTPQQILPGQPAATLQTITERQGNSSAKAPAAVALGSSSFASDTRSLGFHKLSS